MADADNPADGSTDDAGEGTPTGGWHEGVGTVAEEAAKFLRAVSGASDPRSSGPGGVPAERCPTCGGPASGTDGATGVSPVAASSCRRCPLCQTARLTRLVRPDTLDNLAQAVTLFGAALSEFAAQLRDDGRPDAQDDAAENGPGHRAGAEPEDIEVRDGTAPPGARHPRTEEGR